MAAWHYQKDGQQHGPVPSQQLKELAASGHLLPTDLIWKEGMSDWVPASKLKGLFIAQSTVASSSVPRALPIQESSNVGQQPQAMSRIIDAPQRTSRNSKNISIAVVGGGLLLLGVIVVGIASFVGGGPADTSNPGSATPTVAFGSSHDSKPVSPADSLVERSWSPAHLIEFALRYPSSGKSVSLSPDGSLIAICGSEVPVTLVDGVEFRLLHVFEDIDVASAPSLTFSSDGAQLAWCTGPDVVIVNLSSNEIVRRLPAHASPPMRILGQDRVTRYDTFVTFSPDGRHVVTSSNSDDSGAPAEQVVVWSDKQPQPMKLQGKHPIAFSSDGKILAVSQESSEVALWETTNWEQYSTITFENAEDTKDWNHVAQLAFSSDDNSLAVVLVAANNVVQVVTIDGEPVTDFAVPAASANFDLDAIEASNGSAIPTVGEAHIENLAFSASGNTLVAAGGFRGVDHHGFVLLWDTATGQCAWLNGHEGPIGGLSISTGEPIMATIAGDSTVRVWREMPNKSGEFLFLPASMSPPYRFTVDDLGVQWRWKYPEVDESTIAGRTDAYQKGYRDIWETGIRLARDYRTATTKQEQQFTLEQYESTLEGFESSRDVILRSHGANNPNAQRFLGICDGFRDSFSLGVKSGRDR